MSLRCVLVLLVVTVASFARAEEPGVSSWVRVGEDGRLVYRADERGNRVPDFSHAGYAGGGVALPELPVVATIEPAEGDRTQAIQAVIDEVAARRPDDAGFRGAILLKRGTHSVSGSLRLEAGGVVLRGEGQGEDGTVLIAAGATKRPFIVIAGEGDRATRGSTAVHVTDAYVPVGATSFHVDRPDAFRVGDTVIVHRPSTAEWIRAIGMDRIPPRRDGGPATQWKEGGYDLRFDRVIRAVSGTRITIDAPLVNALEAEYGGGRVYAYAFPGRIEHVGVENLRIVSEYAGRPEDHDEDHAWTAIEIDRAQNVWVRDVTSLHFGFGLADIRREAKWVTVQDSTCLDAVSRITGSRRYSFNIAGQLSLVQRCFSREARHDFAVDSRTAGPNAFVDCVAEKSHSDTGPHHRWSVGTLFDNVAVPDHAINLQNRLNLGSGHGWSGANSVLWNCRAKEFVVHDPPTARNWAIGVIGRQRPPMMVRDRGLVQYTTEEYLGANPEPDPAWGFGEGDRGTTESLGTPVQPRSLYQAQLAERLGGSASGAR